MKQHLIGLTGLAGTGKDTVADLLVTHFHFRKLAFADALRGEIADGFGVDMVYLSHLSTKNTPMAALSMRRAPRDFLAQLTLDMPGLPRKGDGCVEDQWMDIPRSPRQIMQWWGTEYRRSQSQNYWTMRLVERINFYRRDGQTRFVITDCRFDNEVDTLRALGGVLWQIKRDGVDGANTPEGTHSSVTDGEAFQPTTVVANRHDIRHLQQVVLTEFVALETGIATAQVTV